MSENYYRLTSTTEEGKASVRAFIHEWLVPAYNTELTNSPVTKDGSSNGLHEFDEEDMDALLEWSAIHNHEFMLYQVHRDGDTMQENCVVHLFQAGVHTEQQAQRYIFDDRQFDFTGWLLKQGWWQGNGNDYHSSKEAARPGESMVVNNGYVYYNDSRYHIPKSETEAIVVMYVLQLWNEIPNVLNLRKA